MVWVNLELFNDSLISEFIKWKNANPETFTWWNYVNMKSDLQTALGFAKFFYPEIIEAEGCFILKDNYSEKRFESWKNDCNGNKTCIEKMMNLYQLRDLFHINTQEEEKENEQIKVLGEVLKLFWSMSFKNRFPLRTINVSVFEEEDGEIFITVYEEL